MPKPMCPKCQLFYRPKKNGFFAVEGKPMGGERVPPGKEAADRWLPYKLWVGDLWECQGCEAQVVVGFASSPISQDYLPDFAEKIERYGNPVQINDC